MTQISGVNQSNNSLSGCCTSRQHFSFFNSWIQVCGVIRQTPMCVFVCPHVWVNDCVSSGLSCSWKAERNFGSGASLSVSFCTIGRCACLCQGTTCHSPPHLDTHCAECPSWTRHGQAKHASDGCLWSSLASFTPSVTLCLASLTYPTVWYKELCLLSHSSQYAEVISCTVTTDTTLLCPASLPHTHSHTNKYNNDCSCFLPMLSLCSCWMRYHFPLVKDNTHTHTCAYVCSFPHNIIPTKSLVLFPFLPLS